MDDILEIFKYSPKGFIHRRNKNDKTDFSLSPGFTVTLGDGMYFKIVERDGSTRYKYKIPNVILIDLTASGTPETYVTIEALEERFRQWEYTPYLSDQQLIQTVVWKKGDGIEINVDLAYINANFDMAPGPNKGLGKNEREGWAIRNGNNGTENHEDRFSMQWGETYMVMGAIGGEAEHKLTKPELPSTLDIDQTAGDTTGGGALATGNANEGTLTINTGGADTPHNNMPPYIVTLKIERTKDLIIYGNGNPGSTPNLQQVLDVSGEATGVPIILTNSAFAAYNNNGYGVVLNPPDNPTGNDAGNLTFNASTGIKQLWAKSGYADGSDNYLPKVGGTFGVSVNGVPFDDNGNVDVSGGSGDASGDGTTITDGVISHGDLVATSLTATGDLTTGGGRVVVKDSPTGDEVFVLNPNGDASLGGVMGTGIGIDQTAQIVDVTAAAGLRLNGRQVLTSGAESATTTPLDAATLNSTYPAEKVGFELYCPDMSDGALIYRKTESGWVSYVVTKIE